MFFLKEKGVVPFSPPRNKFGFSELCSKMTNCPRTVSRLGGLSPLGCVAVCCNALQCVAVCCTAGDDSSPACCSVLCCIA